MIHLYMQNKFFINYWSIENQLKNNCFEGVRFIKYHNDLNKINILYYIKDLINNYKEYIYLSNVLEKMIASINLGKMKVKLETSPNGIKAKYRAIISKGY